MIKLKEFAIIIRTIGIIILFALLVMDVVKIPFFIIVMITVGYLCSAISCIAPLFSPSVEHHKIVNYFIASLGIIVIAKHIINVYN
jgi:hypothetical protein